MRLFRAGEVSPLEVLDAQIAVAQHTEPVVSSLCETMFEDARVTAKAAQEQFASACRTGADVPALLGLTVATKEKHAIAGRELTNGLTSHVGRRAQADHPVVERIVAAGGVLHARTTSPEFSCATVTHSPLWGVTRNPWVPSASPGGSSGGAGAALASGITTLATASDIAGSTRIPAGFTGTVGYKAPYGRIPGAPPLSADWYRGDGPMARTVADAALLARVLSGVHPIDHATVTGSDPSSDAADVRGMRIGVSVRLGDYPVDPAVADVVLGVAKDLESAGAHVVPVELPWTTELVRETIFAHFGFVLAPAMIAAIGDGMDETAAYTRRFVADAAAAAEGRTLVDSLALDARVQHDLAVAMEPIDVLLCPTSAVLALDADGDYLDGIDVCGTHLTHYWEAHMTSPFNVANRCPVLAVPGGMAGGMPVGVQFVGHPYAEASVFRAGAALEAVRPWADGRPELQGSVPAA
ncbi:amidase [Rhodococcus rhodnii]|nr:amidase [Rhodococcus rhodnii]